MSSPISQALSLWNLSPPISLSISIPLHFKYSHSSSGLTHWPSWQVNIYKWDMLNSNLMRSYLVNGLVLRKIVSVRTMWLLLKPKKRPKNHCQATKTVKLRSNLIFPAIQAHRTKVLILQWINLIYPNGIKVKFTVKIK